MDKVYLVDWFDNANNWAIFKSRTDAIQTFITTYKKAGELTYGEDPFGAMLIRLNGKPLARILEMPLLDRADHF